MRPAMITTLDLTVKTQHSSLTESSDFTNNTEDKIYCITVGVQSLLASYTEEKKTLQT